MCRLNKYLHSCNLHLFFFKLTVTFFGLLSFYANYLFVTIFCFPRKVGDVITFAWVRFNQSGRTSPQLLIFTQKFGNSPSALFSSPAIFCYPHYGSCGGVEATRNGSKRNSPALMSFLFPPARLRNVPKIDGAPLIVRFSRLVACCSITGQK